MYFWLLLLMWNLQDQLSEVQWLLLVPPTTTLLKPIICPRRVITDFMALRIRTITPVPLYGDAVFCTRRGLIHQVLLVEF
jgi:hypothetical protein